jgi:hypothetical protein
MSTRPKRDRDEERRIHQALREALDELVQHVRVVRRTLPTMAPHELDHAQERLEWLADEVWRLALDEDRPDEG